MNEPNGRILSAEECDRLYSRSVPIDAISERAFGILDRTERIIKFTEKAREYPTRSANSGAESEINSKFLNAMYIIRGSVLNDINTLDNV